MSYAEKLARVAYHTLICAFVLWIVVLITDFGKDDTDPPGGRSGLALKIDHGTGCQYLVASWGGITPRLDRDGKQVCTN